MLAGRGIGKRPAGGESYNLSGGSDSASEIALVTTGFSFQSTGAVQSVSDLAFRNLGTDFTDGYPTPGADTWIRATLLSGTSPNGGNSLNTWHQVTGAMGVTRAWAWTRTAVGDGAGTTTGSLTVEIATDSGGSNVVATGTYTGESEIT